MTLFWLLEVKPFIPPIDGLDNVNYETTDTFFDLKALPKKWQSLVAVLLQPN